MAKPIQKGIDWSALWKKEDWWACWVGGTVLLLALFKVLPRTAAWKTWTEPLAFLPRGWMLDEWIFAYFMQFFIVLILTSIGLAVMRGIHHIRFHPFGLAFIFCLVIVAYWLGNWKVFKDWGLEVVLWALFLGLFVSNVFKVPKWVKGSVNTEFYIKCGLVMLGAEILFSIIIKGGLIGMGQAIAVVLAVWYVTYWIGRRFGLIQSFSGILATGVAICGVSAAIAAGGALKGDPKHVAYTISWVLIIAMPMMIGMPMFAKAIGMKEVVAGAWFGGTIDTTAAVIAAGELLGKTAMTVAALVKMAQNVLIGFAAFLLACWAAFFLERVPGAKRPPFIEIWYRFPKFIVGFIVASAVFSILEPALTETVMKAILGVTAPWRVQWFVLAFVCIGLDTRFMELVKVGGGKPAVVFCLGQLFNILWTLLICYLLWGGIFFEPPIK